MVRVSRRMVLMISGGAGLVSIGGIIGATFVKSPEQLRAETQPPGRTVLTSVVEKRVLASTVVTRGQTRAAREVEVTPAAIQGAAVTVVTGVFASVGTQVELGDVVLSVSGRPVIALHGVVPPYRDMRPGDNGPDIEQLQASLRALGLYRGGDTNGHLGPATKLAIRKLYAKVGYAVPDTGGPGGKGDTAALRATADDVSEAQQTVNSLTARIAANPSEPQLPGEPTLQQQLTAAQARLARSKQDQAALIASTGPMMPIGELAFLPVFPANVIKVGAAMGQRVEPPLIVFATGALEATAQLPPDQASILKEGMRVKLLAEALGAEATGTIMSIGPVTTPVEQGQTSPPYQQITIIPGEDLPSAWNGLDVRLTITAAQTVAEVLVVPLSAVSAGADGRTTVTVVADDGTQSRIEVRAGISGDGLVEVRPLDGSLSAGDKVVIGQ